MNTRLEQELLCHNWQLPPVFVTEVARQAGDELDKWPVDGFE
jgi:hypothetical protein